MTHARADSQETEPVGTHHGVWRRRALVLALLCGIVFVLHPLLVRVYLGTWTFPFDDPWIHQVYARNLAWHGQYAFNLGEPSTGSSAPLWTILLAPAHLLGLDPVLWALVLGLLSLAGLGAVSWEWAARRFARPLPLLLTVGIVLSPHIAWTGVEGMETALVAALGLFILYRLDVHAWEREANALVDGLLNGIFLWLRPEGPLLTLVLLWHRRRERWTYLLAFGAGFALLLLPYVGLQMIAGGQPLPQTVYAKMAYYGQSTSLSQIGHFLGDLVLIFRPGLMPLILVLLPVTVQKMARRREWPWGPGLLWAGLTLLAAAVRLPTVLHFGRHFAPVLPAVILAGGQAIQDFPRTSRRAALLLAGFLLLIGVIVGVVLYIPLCQGILNTQIAMGNWIADHLPPETTVATHDIGAIAYFGERPVVDTLALITPELTTIVAQRDTAGLIDYLGQRGVRYFATLEEQYREIREKAGVEQVVKLGRMELLRVFP